MGLPTGYFYKDGFYWRADGSGPYGYDGTGTYPLFQDGSIGRAAIRSGDLRLRVQDGRLLASGIARHSVGVNAYDLFTKFLVLGGTTYKTDLATLAANGVKYARVSATFGDAADYPTNHQTYIGVVGASPVATYVPALMTFLDAACNVGIGIVLVLNWRGWNVATTLGSTAMPDIVTVNSVTRRYMQDFTRTVVRQVGDHPAIAAWELGNEWDNAVTNRSIYTSSASPIPAGITVTGAANNGSGAIRLTYAAGTNLVTGVPVRVEDVKGCVEANGEWSITVISGTTCDLVGSTFTNAYTSGGRMIPDFSTPYLSIVNELVAEIRKTDGERPVIAPQACPAWDYESDLFGWARRRVDLAGNCDTATIHVYPDLRPGDPAIGTGSARNLGIGEDLAGMPYMVKELRAEAMRRGKALTVGEVCAFYDKPPGRFAQTSYKASYDAGVELVFDWTWYTASGGVDEDLKTNRAAVLPIIAAWNSSHPVAKTGVEAEFPTTAPLPQTAFIASGVSGSHIAIPLSSGELEPGAGSFFVGFWLSKNEVLGSNVKLLCAGTTARGWSIVSGQSVSAGPTNLHFQIYLNGTVQVIATSIPKARPFERHHYAFWFDGASRVYVWLDALPMGYAQVTAGAYTPMYPTRPNLHIACDIDGSGNPTAQRQMSIMDLWITKDATPATADLVTYCKTGAVPSWLQHRWLLGGNANDSIGSIHGTPGGSVVYGAFSP